MRKFVLLAAGCLSVVASAPAMARHYTVSEDHRGPVATYCSEYVPATVLVNTRGKLVRGQRFYWSGPAAGLAGTWNYDRDPAVYIQTRRTVEQDHYTLVPGPCS